MLAYAKWSGKRVPTEAEFEFAQRGGLERKPYAWRDELKPGGKFMVNTSRRALSRAIRSGPADSFDPSEPGVKKKVHRGGSFLCSDQYCARYIAGGRGKGELGYGDEPCRIQAGARCARSAGDTAKYLS